MHQVHVLLVPVMQEAARQLPRKVNALPGVGGKEPLRVRQAADTFSDAIVQVGGFLHEPPESSFTKPINASCAGAGTQTARTVHLKVSEIQDVEMMIDWMELYIDRPRDLMSTADKWVPCPVLGIDANDTTASLRAFRSG